MNLFLLFDSQIIFFFSSEFKTYFFHYNLKVVVVYFNHLKNILLKLLSLSSSDICTFSRRWYVARGLIFMVIFNVSVLAESLSTCLTFVSISVTNLVFPQTVSISKWFFTVRTRKWFPVTLILFLRNLDNFWGVSYCIMLGALIS